jgi:membrane associated rhomboid family serine protease
MIFFPYRAQIALTKVPYLTLAVIVLCLVIYYFQDRNETAISDAAYSFCEERVGDELRWALGRVIRKDDALASCGVLFGIYHVHPVKAQFLSRLTRTLERRLPGGKEAAMAYVQEFQDRYSEFAPTAPRSLTARLWQKLPSWDPMRMLSATFAHSDWEHVIFNVIFFFAFAASVEMVLGPVLFGAVFIALALGIGAIDSLMNLWETEPSFTLGLSGVVTGMLGLFVYFLPRAKIRFAFWFLLAFGTVGVPAWLVAAWYIGWDAYHSIARDYGSTNVLAHLAGAGLGLAIGFAVFRRQRHWAEGLVVDKLDLSKEESWLSKLNAYATSTAVLPAIFIGTLVVIYYVVRFIESFGWQLLLAAPALAASYYLWSTRGNRTDYGRYQLGVSALEARDYTTAIRHLKPLAERNYPRALHALSWLHLSAPGALRDEREAVRLLTRAAERGHAEAQHLLGTMYADGRGVLRDAPKAIEWYRKAAEAGAPDAAMSLAHLYEHGVGIPADKEQAIELYHRAAILFGKLSRTEDAAAAIRALEGLASHYPAVLALATRLRTATRE